VKRPIKTAWQVIHIREDQAHARAAENVEKLKQTVWRVPIHTATDVMNALNKNLRLESLILGEGNGITISLLVSSYIIVIMSVTDGVIFNVVMMMVS
jgi:hypothetical protein